MRKESAYPQSHFFTEDGRLVSFDASFKDDGTVHPLHYRDFNYDNEETHRRIPHKKSPENYPPVAAPQGKDINQDIPAIATRTIHRYDEIIYTPMAQLKAQYKIKKPAAPRKVFSFKDYKEEKRECQNKLIKKLEATDFTPIARKYLHALITSFPQSAPTSTKDIRKKLKKQGKEMEIGSVIRFFKFYDEVISSTIKKIYDKESGKLQAMSNNTPRKKQNPIFHVKLDYINLNKYKDPKIRDFFKNLYMIIERSFLSQDAVNYFLLRAEKLTPIDIYREDIVAKIEHVGLTEESSRIIDIMAHYNNMLEWSNLSRNSIALMKKDQVSRSPDSGQYSTAQSPTEVSNFVKHGPLPVYGYARDRFGRVQERDSYREDKPINPYSANSDFDQEDDGETLDIVD